MARLIHTLLMLFLAMFLRDHVLAYDAPKDNILQVCENSGALTFVKYARATPWVKKTLENGTGYTALAPTDQAFKNLPQYVKDAIKDPQTLEWYLRYHIALAVVYEREMNQDLRIPSAFRPPGKNEDVSEPVLPIRFNVYHIWDPSRREVVTASGAPIVIPDRQASNGIVHIIDKVMFPLPTGADMAEYLQDQPQFSTLYSLLMKANLTKALKTDPSRPLTIFAPSNTAISKLPKDVLNKLKNVTFLQHVLEYHVVAAALYSAGLYDNQTLHPLFNKTLLVQRGVGGIYVQDSKVVQADTTVANGVVHEINGVLIPPK